MSDIDDALARFGKSGGTDPIDAALARHNDIDAALARHSGPPADRQPGEAVGEIAGFAAQARDDRIRPWLDAVDMRGNLGRETRPWSEVAPPLAGLGVALALPPMAPWAAALAGLGTSAAVRGATPLLKGEGMDAALEEANPLTHPVDTALDVAVPFAGKAISNAMRARRASSLPGYAKAVSANADLPPIDDLATFKDVGEDVSRETVDLGLGGTARAATADPARLLLSRESEAAKLGGESLAGYGEMRRQIRNQAGAEVEEAFRGLSKADAEDVGALLRGDTKPAAPHVHEAAARMKRLLGDLGNRAESVPGMRTMSEEGELVPFRKLSSEFYYPRVDRRPEATVKVASLMRRGGRDLDRVAHQRTGEFNPNLHVTNAKDAVISYVDDMADNVAAAHYFGAPGEGIQWGERADTLYKAMLGDGDALAADVFQSRLNRLLKPQKLGRAEKAAQAVGQKTAHVVLGQSALTSFPQVATAPMRYGYGNTLEGMARYATDPSLRQLYKSSGAMDAGVTQMALEAGVQPKTLPARAMAGMEHFLRGPASAGAVPYAEKLLASAQKAKPSAATLRKLRELRIPLEEARGGMSADLLRRIVQRSSDANQLQAHAIEHAGEIFDSPLARLPLQFMQYPVAQGRMASDAVVRPIASGLRHGNPSEVALGVGRLARWAPAAAGGAAAIEAAKTGLTGQDFEPEKVAYRALETTAGLPGTVATAMLRGQNPVQAVAGSPPSVGLAKQMYQSGERIFDDEPARGSTEIIADILAALDKTGTASLARPTIRGWMRANAER